MVVSARARGWAAILLAAYAALAVFVLLVPRPIDRGFTPLVRRLIAAGQQHGLPAWFDYDFVEYASHGRRLAWLAVLAVLVLGAAVEFGPTLLDEGHVASGLDLYLNELGVLAGGAVGYWALEPAAASDRR